MKFFKLPKVKKVIKQKPAPFDFSKIDRDELLKQVRRAKARAYPPSSSHKVNI